MGRVRLASPAAMSAKPFRKAFPVLTRIGPWSIKGSVLNWCSCSTAQGVNQTMLQHFMYMVVLSRMRPWSIKGFVLNGANAAMHEVSIKLQLQRLL